MSKNAKTPELNRFVKLDMISPPRESARRSDQLNPLQYIITGVSSGDKFQPILPAAQELAMPSFRERSANWIVQLRWRWIEMTWPDVYRELIGWLVVFTLIGLAAWWWLGQRPSEENLATLTTDLHNPAPEVRQRALSLLMEREDAVPAFISALRDKDADIRYEAARALREYQYSITEAVPALINALNDEDAWVRTDAARALGNAGNRAEEAIPALRKAKEDPDAYVSKWAAESLKKLLKQ
jgi:hypothetical protein